MRLRSVRMEVEPDGADDTVCSNVTNHRAAHASVLQRDAAAAAAVSHPSQVTYRLQ